HQACVSLWRGESSLAVAAGVNALLSASGGIGFSKAHMLSPTGRCHPFDAAGDGYVRSEGGAVLVLPPLAHAIPANNPVYAVIAGSGVNSDGRTTGLAMPNQAAQEALLRQVYADAGIDPAKVAYIEAHGTGTSVGDPVECAALGRVFGLSRADADPCRIGSVKGNIGHLEPASRLAGLLKVVLAIRHRALPRTVHFATPNPQIPFAELNLEVVAETTALGPEPLTMGVNSFGFGGTNAHVILREPDTAAQLATPTSKANFEPPEGKRRDRPLLISAHDPEALRTLARPYAGLLRSPGPADFAAGCRNAAMRRTHHRYRLAIIGTDSTDAADRLDAFAADDPRELTVEGQAASARRLAFVFAGNGSQWRGMGRDLCEDPELAASVARVDAVLEPLLGWSVGEALRSGEPPDLYDRTEFAQP